MSKLTFFNFLDTHKEGRLGDTVYRNLAPTDSYLHNKSNRTQQVENRESSNPKERARRICEQEDLATITDHASNQENRPISFIYIERNILIYQLIISNLFEQ